MVRTIDQWIDIMVGSEQLESYYAMPSAWWDNQAFDR
jgi:hypothetical protein